MDQGAGVLYLEDSENRAHRPPLNTELRTVRRGSPKTFHMSPIVGSSGEVRSTNTLGTFSLSSVWQRFEERAPCHLKKIEDFSWGSPKYLTYHLILGDDNRWRACCATLLTLHAGSMEKGLAFYFVQHFVIPSSLEVISDLSENYSDREKKTMFGELYVSNISPLKRTKDLPFPCRMNGPGKISMALMPYGLWWWKHRRLFHQYYPSRNKRFKIFYVDP